MATQADVSEGCCEGKKRTRRTRRKRKKKKKKKNCVTDGVWLAQLVLEETSSSSQRRG